ncbi:hypothetical protein [Laceyella putida]|uniref:WD40 repeat domain-containing protein n=1 Tax=Laceyella putida TaxID=110101 RepID=A0ABW2RJD6_9BACL
MMDWSKYEDLSKQWIEKGKAYAFAVNEYNKKVFSQGYDADVKPPEETRAELARTVLEVIHEANRTGEIDQLRAWFPPAYAPFIPWVEKNQSYLDSLFMIDEDLICFRKNSFEKSPQAFIVNGQKCSILDKVLCVGRSPDRRFYALAYIDRIELYEGWNGVKVCQLHWPKHLEGLEETKEVVAGQPAPSITSLLVFPDGKRVLLLNRSGLFVIEETKAFRIHPDRADIEEMFAGDWANDEHPLSVDLSMEHVAMSPDGKYIAVGDQASNHRILDASFREIATIAPSSSYPHYAIFRSDSKQVAFNSCHFYNGETVGISLDHLSLTKRGFSDIHDRTEEDDVVLNGYCRVYAGVSVEDRYIFGDAYGFINAHHSNGELLWDFHVGGTITGMDVSEDGRKIVVGTYGGMLHLIHLDTGEVDPFAIGFSTNKELRRWLMWDELPQPLVW